VDKKVRFQQDCHKLAFRIYGKAYANLDDSQVAVVSRLAQGRTRFNFKRFIAQLLTGSN
jgi:hypothetical protein